MLIGGPIEFDQSLLTSDHITRPNELINFPKSNFAWMSSGRSSIALVLETFRNKISKGKILIPDYRCWATDSVFDSFETKSFPINKQLKIDFQSLEKLLLDKEIKAIFIIDYFGINAIDKDLEFIKSKRPDILIFLDAAQSFFNLFSSSDIHKDFDAIISSPRKFLPIPDGGLVIFPKQELNTELLQKKETLNHQIPLFISVGILRKARQNLTDQDTSIDLLESIYLKEYESYKKLFNNKRNLISELSFEMLKKIDFPLLISKRSLNLETISNLFSQSAFKFIEPIFNSVITPALIFPLRVGEGQRDSLLRFLRSKNIFCPVHWPLPDQKKIKVNDISVELSNEILGLPIDQRYDIDTMHYLFERLVEFNRIT
tara:strand:+ start:661 stop:1779 length:1119 start_codon:yes stop_codon:yes gene_type:complete